MISKKTIFILACILFVLSGVAALIYQVTWFKHLSYFMGNSSYAQAVVLATFMGGLAVGSWWWGKKSDETKNPLKIFAWLEISIGIYCLFYMPIFEQIKYLFVQTVVNNNLETVSTEVFFLKIIASVSAILLPTILMGGTLPVLVKYLSGKIEEVGRNVSILYFINSFGAIIGSMAAGFYLIGEFGLTTSTHIGAILDIIVGVAVLLYFKLQKGHPHHELTKEDQADEKQSLVFDYNISTKQRRIVIAIAGLSGLCAMMYEVVWLRLLIPILSSTTHSFTLVLTAFISGITLGSIIIYFLLPYLKNSFKTLGYCQFGIVISMLLTIPFYEKLPYFIWSAIELDHVATKGYSSYLTTQFLYIICLMIVPTVFMGMSLPLATKLLVKQVEKTGELVGKTFSANTIGTVIGSLLAGLLLIPTIGIKSTMELAIFFNLILFIVAYQASSNNSKIELVVILLILSGSVGLYKVTTDTKTWTSSIMLSDIGRVVGRRLAPESFSQFREEMLNQHDSILYYNEGVGGTVVVAQTGRNKYLYTNGKCDGSSISDAITQIELAQIPMILHPNADTVLVIGLGTGQSIGHVMTHSSVSYAEVAEISPEVVEASKYFDNVNLQPLDNQKVHLIQEDGIVALTLSPHKYDVIISEPSNPWSSGIGNLFTKEVFKLAKSKLRKNGILAQWFHLYEMDDATLRLILRTVSSEFEYLKLWKLNNTDLLVMGSSQKFNDDLSDIEKKYLVAKPYLEELDENLGNFTSFLAQELIAETSEVDNYVGKGSLNTEDHPILELWAPKAHYNNAFPTNFFQNTSWNSFSESELLLNKYRKEKPLNAKQKLEITLVRSDDGNDGSRKFVNEFNRFQENEDQLDLGDKTWSQHIHFFGWLNEKYQFFPLDSINPNQQIKSWTCCTNYEETSELKYLWKAPSGKIYSKIVLHETDWTTAWVSMNAPLPMQKGKWQFRLYKNQQLLAVDSMIVSDAAPLLKSNLSHSTIEIAYQLNGQLHPMKNANPEQKLFLCTSGQEYGKKETVNIRWVSPSGKIYNKLFQYKENYAFAWVPCPVPGKLKEGTWTITVGSLNEDIYLKMDFLISGESKIVGN